MAKLAIHPVGLAVVIFGLLCWVIALGGLGAATYGCQSTNSYEYCGKTYQVIGWASTKAAEHALHMLLGCPHWCHPE